MEEFDSNKFGHIIDVFNPVVPPSVYYKFWQDLTIAPFDVETTGVEYGDPDTFRIVQFSVGYYDRPPKGHRGLHEPELFKNWFIDPEMEVPVGAMKVHGLYHSDYNDYADVEKHGKQNLKGFPTFEEVADEIIQVMLDAPIWSAFKHTFDTCALASELMRVGRDPILKPTIDPLMWERYRRKKMSGNTLWNTAKRFGVATVSNVMDGEGTTHDARTDIQLLNDVLWAKASGLPCKVYDIMRRQVYLLKKHEQYYYEKYK
jgi:DNA polymerase III epsilon subunit-like protein